MRLSLRVTSDFRNVVVQDLFTFCKHAVRLRACPTAAQDVAQYRMRHGFACILQPTAQPCCGQRLLDKFNFYFSSSHIFLLFRLGFVLSILDIIAPDWYNKVATPYKFCRAFCLSKSDIVIIL